MRQDGAVGKYINQELIIIRFITSSVRYFPIAPGFFLRGPWQGNRLLTQRPGRADEQEEKALPARL